ncbi:hypothetical protein [uncultured Caulobacter sp.]|uniref:hypothetical protein n=1 Tax=uncultured Caulobacter sp. TaxID=158749 RepID=UPI00260C7723|nr:hypothetical protein [uncultured Caulobacter sp.]
MSDGRSAELRRTLEDLDLKLLSLVDGKHPLDEDALRAVALYETARVAVLRLLDEAETRARG